MHAAWETLRLLSLGRNSRPIFTADMILSWCEFHLAWVLVGVNSRWYEFPPDVHTLTRMSGGGAFTIALETNWGM